jgi:hypothetical protein
MNRPANSRATSNSRPSAQHNAVASDPKFAADATARLDFFLRRHASWDVRSNLYPILRLPRPL